jgi:hypothetical protein
MGLLDDAIREHLELKRQSGADPGEIALKEHEALAPVFSEEAAASEEGLGSIPNSDEPAAQTAFVEEPPAADDVAPHLVEPSAQSHVGQETAELDMQAYLDEQLDSTGGSSAADLVAARPVRGDDVSDPAPEVDSLEWEVPGASEGQAVPADIPGQERLSFE